MWNDYSYVVESLRVINNLVVYNLLTFPYRNVRRTPKRLWIKRVMNIKDDGRKRRGKLIDVVCIPIDGVLKWQ